MLSVSIFSLYNNDLFGGCLSHAHPLDSQYMVKYSFSRIYNVVKCLPQLHNVVNSSSTLSFSDPNCSGV